MENVAGEQDLALQQHFIRFFHQSHNTVHFGGLFTLKQWIISSLKHDTVPRVNKLHCFYVKNPPKRIALWDRENSQYKTSKFSENSNCRINLLFHSRGLKLGHFGIFDALFPFLAFFKL